MIRMAMFRVKNSMLFACCVVGLAWILCARFFNAGTSDAFYSEQNYQEDLGRVYLDLGRFSVQRGDIKKATHFFKHAIKLNARYLEAYCALGSLYDLQKKNKKSLNLYLKTLHTKAKKICAFENNQNHLDPQKCNTIPQWNGENLENKTIFVYSDEEHPEDRESIFIAMRFSRFIPLLAKERNAKKIYFKPPLSLAILLARVDLRAEIVSDFMFSSDTPIDYYVPLASLPHLMGCSPESIPCPDGYLHADDERKAIIRSTIFENVPKNCSKIGFYFPHSDSSTTQLNFKALIHKMPTTTFYDLSKNNHDIETLSAIISHLDAVIGFQSIQTELAGALGTRVLVIAPQTEKLSWFESMHHQESTWYQTAVELRESIDDINTDAICEFIANIQMKKTIS